MDTSTDEQPGADDSGTVTPQPRRMRGLTAAVVALGLAVIVIVAGRNTHDRPPYGAKAVAATAQLQVVPAGQAQRRLDALAGRGRLTAAATDGYDDVIGQLRFVTPDDKRHPGVYVLVIVDNASHRPLDNVVGVGPPGTTVIAGWDHRYDALSASHSLFAQGATGTALSFAPQTPSPVTFEAQVPAGRVTDPRSQLTVALAFFATDGHVYWVATLPS